MRVHEIRRVQSYKLYGCARGCVHSLGLLFYTTKVGWRASPTTSVNGATWPSRGRPERLSGYKSRCCCCLCFKAFLLKRAFLCDLSQPSDHEAVWLSSTYLRLDDSCSNIKPTLHCSVTNNETCLADLRSHSCSL